MEAPNVSRYNCWPCQHYDLQKPVRVVIIALGALVTLGATIMFFNALLVGLSNYKWIALFAPLCQRIGCILSLFISSIGIIGGVTIICGAANQ